MDLSFARRRRPAPADTTPALASLLSETAARAAVTPTAQAQARLASARAEDATDPRVAIFAADTKSVADVRSFGELGQATVTSGQRT